MNQALSAGQSGFKTLFGVVTRLPISTGTVLLGYGFPLHIFSLTYIHPFYKIPQTLNDCLQ